MITADQRRPSVATAC